MNARISQLVALLLTAITLTVGCAASGQTRGNADSLLGRIEISTIPVDPALMLRSATYTPSGRVLVSYANSPNDDRRQVNLAVMDENGANMRTIFSQRIPDLEKDNGIRFMVFPDNRRIFLGDFILECAPSLDACDHVALLPVTYPAEVAGGDHIDHRWSEIIVAPDNRHVAWTTLLSNYSALVFVGELEETDASYRIVNSQIVSSLDPFPQDPAHPDGVLPQRIRGGEVKQFVHGGTAISLVGAGNRDIANSVMQDLLTGAITPITDTPGYTETTIFSPDERLGITMTTRFSEPTDLAILGLMPRPYPDSLNMGLNMHAYTYSVTGVRASRPGNIGPALIDIGASTTQPNYLGINLNTDEAWVYRSPMSWRPDSRSAMWLEARRDGGSRRIQVVHLLDYQPAAAVAAQSTPSRIPYASTDLSVVADYARQERDRAVRVYGRRSGYIDYRRSEGAIEKTYVAFSDDGESIYAGSERIELNPRANSVYTANLRLSGPRPGEMNLRMTFGPLGGNLPAALIFTPDESGMPSTRGYVDFDGRRLNADDLAP